MNTTKNILYLGWLGKGNVGDDVLFELFKQLFYKHYPTRKNTAVNIDSYPIVNHYEIDLSNYDLIVLGGGSLLHLPYWLHICSIGISKNIPVASWGTGIDGLFKSEGEAITLANPLRAYQSIYNQLDYISVRGPYTKTMLQHAGTKKDIYVIGDPALHYSTAGENVAANNQHIMVNWGTAYNHLSKECESDAEDELCLAIRTLIEKGYHISIYPIWIADIPAVRQLALKVNHPRCIALEKVYEAKILLKMLQQCYATINLKLHANVLSAAANRPSISLAYSGKCFDFAVGLGMLEYTIAVESVTCADIMKRFWALKHDYDANVLQLEEAKSKYSPKLITSIYNITSLLEV